MQSARERGGWKWREKDRARATEREQNKEQRNGPCYVLRALYALAEEICWVRKRERKRLSKQTRALNGTAFLLKIGKRIRLANGSSFVPISLEKEVESTEWIFQSKRDLNVEQRL